MNILFDPQPLQRLSADLKLTSNGDGAKTAKVSIVARTGDPVDFPDIGPVVHDFAGMTIAKNRIPLDVNHDQSNSIGYLNNFDTSSGNLVCSGAIVIVDDPTTDVSALVQKLLAGVPYEASIQADDDMTLNFVPEGASIDINGRTLDGPLTVVSQWTLKAVSICKFGMDPDTSTDLKMSKEKMKANEGFQIRLSKKNITNYTGFKMSEQTKDVTAVETKVEIPTQVGIVEAKVEAPKVTEEKPVEATTKVVAVETKTEGNAVVTDVPAQLSKVATVTDSREEFKQFLTAFGREKAAEYFSEGLNYTDALTKFALATKAENEDLKTRLAAVDRGADKPVRFSKVDAEAEKGTREITKMSASKGLASLINITGSNRK